MFAKRGTYYQSLFTFLCLAPFTHAQEVPVPLPLTQFTASRFFLVSAAPLGHRLQAGGSLTYTLFQAEGTRQNLGVSTVSRAGDPCLFGSAEVYLINGFSVGLNLEVRPTGLSLLVEGVWYPTEGLQGAFGLDVLRGRPYSWVSFWR